MADKVKGLTIEIGGETKEFEKALADSQKSAKNLQTELNIINKALKLDPKNVDIVTQKSKVLKEAISEARTKVDILKLAQAQMDERMKQGLEVDQEEYRKVQREIVFAEAKLKDLLAQRSVFDKLKDGAASVAEKVLDFGRKVGEVALKVPGVQKVVTAFGNVRDKIKDAVTSSAAFKTMESAIGAVKKKVDDAKTGLQAFAEKHPLVGKIGEAFNTAKTKVSEFVEKNQLVKKAEVAFGNLVEKVGHIGGKLKEAAGKVGEFGAKAGEVTLKATAGFAKVAAVVGGAAVAAAGVLGAKLNTLVMQGGFDRAMNIEGAKAKLEGLGHSADAVKGIMDNALAAVEGTAYGLGDAATVAASAVAAGVPQGKELERTLKLVADASTISGRGMDEMGAIFNKVAASNKISGMEMNQLTKAGIPIQQLLADTMGVSAGEVGKLVSAGKVGFAEFQDAMEKGMGEAALKSGQTFTGAMANTKAAFARVGEIFITPLTQSLTPALGVLTQIINKIKKGSLEGMDGLVSDLGKMLQDAAKELITNVKPLLDSFIRVIGMLMPELAEVLKGLLPVVIDAILSLAQTILENVPVLLGAGSELFSGLIEGVVSMIPALIEATAQIIGSIITALVEALPSVLSAGVEILHTLTEGIRSGNGDMLAGIASILGDFLGAIFEYLPQLLEAGVELIVALIEGIGNSLPDLIQQVGDMFPQMVSKINEKLPDILTKGGDILSSLISGILGAIPKLVNALPDVINSILNTLQNNLPYILDSGVKILTSLINGIVGAIPSLVNALPKILTSIIKFVIQSLPSIIEAGIKIIGALAGGLIKAIPAILAAVPQIIKAIFDVIKGTDWLKLGKDIIMGIVNGLKGAGSAVKDAIMDVAKGALDGVKNFFHIKSPSKKMEDEVGEPLPEGMAAGVTKKAGVVKKSLVTVASDALSGAKDAISGIAGSMSGTLAGTINGTISDAKDGFLNLGLSGATLAYAGIPANFGSGTTSNQTMTVNNSVVINADHVDMDNIDAIVAQINRKLGERY